MLLAPGARPEMSAVRVETAPVIDGHLEALWARSGTTAFIQRFPSEGAAPSETTELSVLYDQQAIYFGVRCHHQRTPIVARLARRDSRVESDHVEIDLDTQGDAHAAFHFELNASGVQVDGIRSDSGELGQSIQFNWDEVWSSGASTSSAAWEAELAIPLRALRFEARPENQWGLQVRRRISARGEVVEWAPVSREAAGEMLHYGRLLIHEGLTPQGIAELRPFVRTGLTRRDAHPEVVEHGTELGFGLGLDGKLHLTERLTLDVAVLPDFGQVEADQVILNLSNVEFAFPEKRPFFLEGVEIFGTPMFQLLYSRRIGKGVESPELPSENDQLLLEPDAVPIYGALKLTGRLSSSLSVGVLSALTGPRDARILGADGVRRELPVEPLAGYQVARAKLALTERLQVGLLGTAVLRFEEPERYARTGPELAAQLCPDGEEVKPGERCTRDAFVLGADAQWRSSNGDWILAGNVLGSAIHGGPPRTLADGTVVGSGDLAPGVGARAAKEGGRFILESQYLYAAPRLVVNELGFLERQNVHRMFLSTGIKLTGAEGDALLESVTRVEGFARFNAAGLPLLYGAAINSWSLLSSQLGFWANLYWRGAAFDDREVGDGTALERSGQVGAELYVQSDPRAAVAVELWNGTAVHSNGVETALDGRIIFHTVPELDLELLPLLAYTTGEPRHAGDGPLPGTLLFGRLRATSLGLTLRATWTFTPTLTLQAYAQLFLDFLDYRELSYATPRDGRVRLADLIPTSGRAEGLDEEDGALNLNLVLRWELLPGCTLFVVYTRAQAGDRELSVERHPTLSLRTVGGGPADDSVLLKLTWWLGV